MKGLQAPEARSTALPLCTLAPAKINLGLFVGALRADSRHRLVTVMQAISLADRVRLEAASGARDEVMCPDVGCAPHENLAARALALLRAEGVLDCPPLRLSIEKSIPVAGGLAGGSADAGAALRLAETLLAGARSSAPGGRSLLALAAQLGADVPAQVFPGRYLATGAGERLDALPEAGGSCGVLLIALARELKAGAVYAHAERLRQPRSRAELAQLAEALQRALGGGAALPPAELLENDLQDAARALCPEIGHALELAREAGARHALVSGSGPTVIGLFPGVEGPAQAQRAAAALRTQLSSERSAREQEGTGSPLGAGALAAIHAASFMPAQFARVRSGRDCSADLKRGTA